jgi:long-subunit fatty acid transport protein
VGLVYKTGGEYDFDGRLAQGLRVRAPSVGVNIDESAEEAFTERVQIPDFAGIGLAWRVSDQFMISFDADWIEYSVLQSGLLDDPETPDFVRRQLEEVDDEIEYHLGLEYTFFPGKRNLPFSLRAGAWTDNDHDGVAAIDSDQIHYTAGIGWVITEGFQLDLAAHWADTVTEGLLSMVYRF